MGLTMWWSPGFFKDVVVMFLNQANVMIFPAFGCNIHYDKSTTNMSRFRKSFLSFPKCKLQLT